MRYCQIIDWMFYKIINEHVCVEFHNHLQPNESSTRGRSLKFRQVPTRVDAYLYSFLPSAIQQWNSLPCQAAQSLTFFDFNYSYVHHTL